MLTKFCSCLLMTLGAIVGKIFAKYLLVEVEKDNEVFLKRPSKFKIRQINEFLHLYGFFSVDCYRFLKIILLSQGMRQESRRKDKHVAGNLVVVRDHGLVTEIQYMKDIANLVQCVSIVQTMGGESVFYQVLRASDHFLSQVGCN